MKKPGLLVLLIVFLISGALFGQHSNKTFKRKGVNAPSIVSYRIFSNSVGLVPCVKNGSKSYGFNAGPNIGQNGDK